MPATRTIVLSDIHLGAQTPATVFRHAERLAGFLQSLQPRPGESLELILAGDIFDFLLCPGYAGFEPRRAALHFEAILSNPDTQTVVQSLRTLAGQAEVELTLLSGNHDPELLLPDVRGLLETTLHRRGSLRWADDEPLVPRNSTRMPVWGHKLTHAGQEVWVVHGDRWDRENVLDRSLVQKAIAEGSTVQLPPGSHLVFEVLVPLKPNRSWLDVLKPELPGVLLVLLYLNPRLVGQWLQKHWKLSSTLLLSKLLSSVEAPNRFDGPSRAMGPTLASAPAPAPASTPATQQDPTAPDAFVQALASALSEAPVLERKAMLDELDRLLEKGNPPARTGPVLAAHGGLRPLLLRHGLNLLARDPRFLALEAEDSVLESARIFLPPQVQALIAGHTHGARVCASTRPRYFNTGTWLPVGLLPEGDLKVWLDLLEQDRWRPESPCTFLEARVERDAWQLRLGKVTPEGSTVWPGPVEP